MEKKISSSAVYYNKWQSNLNEEEREFSRVLENIWKMLTQESNDKEFERGFNYLIFFIRQVQFKQNRLIFDLCRSQGYEYWDYLLIRAENFYCLIKQQMDLIIANTSGLSDEDFHKYICRVFVNILIRCNNDVIEELYDPRKMKYNDDFPGDTTDPAKMGSSEPPEPVALKTIGENIADQQCLDGARKIYLMIKENWNLNKINALCQYYEKSAGRETERLKDEKQDNIHKHHQRLRDTITGWVECEMFKKEEVRAFFSEFMPKLCQETEPSRTYKYIKEKMGGNHA